MAAACWPRASGPSIGCRENRSKASASNRPDRRRPADRPASVPGRVVCASGGVGLGADADPVDARRRRRCVPLVSTAMAKPRACKASISGGSSCSRGSPPVQTTSRSRAPPPHAAATACGQRARRSRTGRRPRRPCRRNRCRRRCRRRWRGPARGRSTDCSRRSGRTPPRGPAWPPSPCRVRKISLTA